MVRLMNYRRNSPNRCIIALFSALCLANVAVTEELNGVVHFIPDVSVSSSSNYGGSNNDGGIYQSFKNFLSGRLSGAPEHSPLAEDVPAEIIAGEPAPRPVVIWHGLGDSYDSDGMNRVAITLRRARPGTFVYSIRVSNSSRDDSQAGFVGHVKDQLDEISQQIKNVPELQGGFDAMGFSQGGVFLRGYLQQYNDPPIRNLITFGSPHNGVASLPQCENNNFVCRRRNELFEARVYTESAQTTIIPAQYFRDPLRYNEYIEMSGFLADLNNERANYHGGGSTVDALVLQERSTIQPVHNKTFAANFAQTQRLVMVLFDTDITVVPKESAWFQEVDKTTGVVTPLEQRPLYTQDWIGIKNLGDRGGIVYETLPGAHMEIKESDLTRLSLKYLG